MKTNNTKHWLLACLAVAGFITLSLSCDQRAENPIQQSSQPGIRNTSWTLVAFEVASREIDIQGPLGLVYHEDRFSGNDGCRDFGGSFIAERDSIFPQDVTPLPPLLCTIVTTPIEPLLEPYRIQLSGNELRISGRDVIYIFASTVVDSIQN